MFNGNSLDEKLRTETTLNNHTFILTKLKRMIFLKANCTLQEEFVDGVSALYDLYEFRYVVKDRVMKMYFEAFLN